MSRGTSTLNQCDEYVKLAREFLAKEGLEEPAASSTPSDGLAPRGSRALFSKDFFEAQMQVVIDEGVPVYAAGLGDPGPYIEKLHATGTVVMAVVGAVRHARKVASSGVDVIVAQGHDAGGHNSPIGTMALLPQVVDAAPERGIPVLAAGGIGDGRPLAAALLLSRQAVCVDTGVLGSPDA